MSFLIAPAERAAELLLREAAEPRAVGQARGQAGPLLIFVQRAVDRVGAGLGHDVDEAAGTASELGGRAVGHHLEFLDRVETDRKGRPLAAALLAEERVVVVRAVDRHVVVDALLAVDRNLVAVGTLHDGDSRRERHEAQEVAAVVRQIVTERWSRYVEFSTRPDSRIGASRRDRNHLLHLRDAQRQGQAKWSGRPRGPGLREPASRSSAALTVTLYGPSGSSSPRKRPSASVVRARVKLVPRLVTVTWAPADSAAGRVVHDSFDVSGVGLGLGEDQALSESDGRQETN